MKIYIQSGYGFNFEPMKAFKSVDRPTITMESMFNEKPKPFHPELFVVGRTDEEFHLNANQPLVVYGILERKGRCFLYEVRYINKSYYEWLEKRKVGKDVQIYSDISTGFWGPVPAVTVQLSDAEAILKKYDQYFTCDKTPNGFMF